MMVRLLSAKKNLSFLILRFFPICGSFLLYHELCGRTHDLSPWIICFVCQRIIKAVNMLYVNELSPPGSVIEPPRQERMAERRLAGFPMSIEWEAHKLWMEGQEILNGGLIGIEWQSMHFRPEKTGVAWQGNHVRDTSSFPRGSLDSSGRIWPQGYDSPETLVVGYRAWQRNDLHCCPLKLFWRFLMCCVWQPIIIVRMGLPRQHNVQCE